MKFKKPLLIMFTALLILLFPTPARASQQPGHIYIALKALEAAPPDLRQMLLDNKDYYIAGATGPDIALAAYPLREVAGMHHPGSLPHYHKTGQLIMNMLDLAEADWERAFVLGWLTHYVTDNTIHPLVNQYGGYYTGKKPPAGGRKAAKNRHVNLELFEARHVFDSYVHSSDGPAGDIDSYTIGYWAVPVQLIEKSFYATYVQGTLDMNRFRFTAPFLLSNNLTRGAISMGIATESFVNQAKENRRSSLSTRRISDFVIHNGLGGIPTASEYEKLMKPLKITGVTLGTYELDGQEQELVRIAYRINDLRLHKAFADQWDRTVGEAVQQISQIFDLLSQGNELFSLDNMNLDTGKPEEWDEDVASFFPGNPEIQDLLVKLSILDAEGTELSFLLPEGQFSPLGPLTEEVWGGRAGDAVLEIPLLLKGPGPYKADVTLELACRVTSESYGIKDRWTDTLGEEEIRWDGGLTVESYNGMSINNIPTWQGPGGKIIPFSIYPRKAGESLIIRRAEIGSTYYFSRGSLFLLTAPEVSESTFTDITNMMQAIDALYAVDAPKDPQGEIPEWLTKAVENIDFPRDSALIKFSLITRGAVSGDEYMNFIGILNEDWTGAMGTFEGGYIGHGKDIAGTWFIHPHQRVLR